MEDRYSCGAPARPPGSGPPRLSATTGPVRGSAVPVERLLVSSRSRTPKSRPGSPESQSASRSVLSLPRPAKPHDGLLDRPQVPLHLVLAAQRHLFTLDDVPAHAIPDRPPDAGRQHGRVELHANVQVLQPPHHRPAELPFMRIVQVSGVAVGRHILKADRLASRQFPGERDCRGVQALADLVELTGDLAASLSDL